VVDHSKMKLGRLRKRDNEFVPRLHWYGAVTLPAPPSAIDWTRGLTQWGAMKNDVIGDCTCAAAGHMEEVWAWNSTSAPDLTVSDDQVISAYSAVTGYDPKTGANDNGAVETDVLNYWMNTGIAGNKIDAYARVQVTNVTAVKQAIAMFGGAYLGIELPLSAQIQIEWDTPKRGWFKRLFHAGSDDTPGSWGGHAVPVVGYDENGLTCITWGETKRLTWAFFEKYCDECYAIVSPQWFKDGRDPDGLDLETLKSDLKGL